jgi:hypothetical protein
MDLEIKQGYRTLAGRIAKERGDFVLFALFLREDVPDRWDLIVAAPWATENRAGAVSYFIEQISAQLGRQSLTNLTQIVVADHSDEAVRKITRAIRIEHGEVEVRDSSFFGLPVKEAVFFAVKQWPSTHAA